MNCESVIETEVDDVPLIAIAPPEMSAMFPEKLRMANFCKILLMRALLTEVLCDDLRGPPDVEAASIERKSSAIGGTHIVTKSGSGNVDGGRIRGDNKVASRHGIA